MKPLPQDRLDKTLLGIVTDWRELFIEHRFGKKGRSKTPWVTHHPADFYFLASEDPRIKCLGNQIKDWLSLYVKPNPKIEPVIHSVCTPPIRKEQTRYNFQAFKIIPWPDYGMALITATDVNMIAEPWVCFIPLSAVPDINPENTAMFSTADWPERS